MRYRIDRKNLPTMLKNNTAVASAGSTNYLLDSRIVAKIDLKNVRLRKSSYEECVFNLAAHFRKLLEVRLLQVKLA